MPVPKQIQIYLDKKGVKYAIVTHRKVYTAYDAAQTMRKKLDEIVKNLLIKTNKGFVVVVLPASKNVNMAKLKQLMSKQGTGITSVKIPKEGEMVRLLKVKAGALPAFGSVHDLQVYMDKSMQKVKKAMFPTGSFTDSIEMAVKEFEKLEQPVIGAFSEVKKFKPVKKVVKKVKKTVKKAKKVGKKTFKKSVKNIKKVVKKAKKKTK